MAKPLWKLFGDGFADAFQDVIADGAFAGPMTKTSFTLGHGDNRIVFTGAFKLEGGVIVSGKVTGFKIYSADVLLASTEGHGFGFAALGIAVGDVQSSDDWEAMNALLAPKGWEVRDVGGVDVFSGTDRGDILRGYGGGNHMEGLGGNDWIYGGGGTDGLEGGGGDDTLFGAGGGDTLDGAQDQDVLYGGDGADTLYGRSGNDRLYGGKGNDRLDGGNEREVLSGGAGKDTFVFDGEFAVGRQPSRILDFTHGLDKLEVDGSWGGVPEGGLAKAAFHAGASAHDDSDRLIYNKATGALFYDPDGLGGEAAVKIAVLAGKPTLTHLDFIIAA